MGRIVRTGSTIDKPIIGEAVAQAGEARIGAKEEKGGDNYLERIAKYIPAEVVAFFIFVNSILGNAIDKQMSNSTPQTYPELLCKALETTTMAGISVWYLSWAVFVLGVVVTPLYLMALRNPDDPQEQVGLNILMALMAFPVWAYAVDAVAFRPWHDGALASIILASFSAISGAISPKLIASVKATIKHK